jgi:hypothetical protein
VESRGGFRAQSAETNIARQTARAIRTFAVDPLWQHRLVRAEVDLKSCRIRFYPLRRRAPDQHCYPGPQMEGVTHTFAARPCTDTR